MNILTSAQCRAARGLLNWSQSDLADYAKTHVQTISNFEKDTKIPTNKTLQAIRSALEIGGLEFMEDGGLRPTSRRILTLSGHVGIARFFDLVYETAMEDPNADLCVTNSDEELYTFWLKEYDPIHVNRMIISGKKVRSLVREGNEKIPWEEYVEYKWLSQEIFSDISIYLFGKKTAFLEFLKQDVEITIVDNPAVTRTMRKLFELSWKMSTKIPKK